MKDELNKIKKGLIETLLDHNELIHLRIRVDTSGVKAPPYVKNGKEEVLFVVGNAPTPDLAFKEGGLDVPMRFSTELFTCFFPWESIVMITDGNTMFVLDDKKRQASKKRPAGTARTAPAKRPSTPEQKRPNLTLVK